MDYLSVISGSEANRGFCHRHGLALGPWFGPLAAGSELNKCPATLQRLETLPMDDDQLSQFRHSIDNIDAAFIHMLAERFRITQAVGKYKAESGMPPADPIREQEQIKRLRKLAEQAGLDPEFSEKFLRFVIDEVIRHHERIADLSLIHI